MWVPRSVGESGDQLRFCHRNRLDPLRTRSPRRIRGSAPLSMTWVPWGADHPIRRANRVVRDEEGRCGSRGAWVNPATSSASATGTVSIRCERDRRGGSEDPHPTTTWVPWGADHPIRRANRVVRDEEGRCGSRGAWVNPATSSASATGTVSIRCERDRRGGSEDPHPYR